MRYIASAYSDRFAHPILAGVNTVAVVFFLLAIGIEFAAPFTIPVWGRQVPRFAAGFFGVLGVLTAAIGLLAYGTLFAAKFVSIVRDKMGPTAA